MLLSVLNDLSFFSTVNSTSASPVTGVTLDSRRVKPGFIFIASKGATHHSANGLNYVNDAINRGAIAIVAEDVPNNITIPFFKTPNARLAAAKLSELFYDSPSSKLTICGITGTSGKTTTTFLLQQLFASLQKKSAVIGTLGFGEPNNLMPLAHTTPEAEDLSQIMALLVKQETSHAFMEVSSHALATYRADGINFKVAAFTNFSQDHLDFHGNMDDYRKAKERLFLELLASNNPAVVPHNSFIHHLIKICHPRAGGDPGAAPAQSNIKNLLDSRLRGNDKLISYGSSSSARVSGKILERSLQGLVIELHIDGVKRKIHSNLYGDYNLENLLCAAAVAFSLKLSIDEIAHGLASALPPPGRFERIGTLINRAPTVIVDYAHKPDALKQALIAARALTNNRLIVVFGCGGERDKEKRPLMGSIAAEYADLIFLAHDNPRTEDPQQILQEIYAGISEEYRNKCFIIGDRRTAVKHAIAHAQAGELVMIAGKGHESTQQIGKLMLPCSDKDLALDALEALYNE